MKLEFAIVMNDKYIPTFVPNSHDITQVFLCGHYVKEGYEINFQKTHKVDPHIPSVIIDSTIEQMSSYYADLCIRGPGEFISLVKENKIRFTGDDEGIEGFQMLIAPLLNSPVKKNMSADVMFKPAPEVEKRVEVEKPKKSKTTCIII